MVATICKICGSDKEWERCWIGCEEGYYDGYDDDPLWYEPGDMIPCSACNGKGGFWICPNVADEQHRAFFEDERNRLRASTESPALPGIASQVEIPLASGPESGA